MNPAAHAGARIPHLNGVRPVLLMHFDGNLTDATGNNALTGAVGYEAGPAGWGQVIKNLEGGAGVVATSTVNMSIGGRPWTLEGRSKFDTGHAGGVVICKNYYPSEPSAFSTDYVVGVGPSGMSIGWRNLLYSLTTSFPAIENTWFWWAMSDDGTALRFYVNGVRISSAPSCELQTPPPVTSSAAQVSILNSLQGFLGADPNWGAGKYRGHLDELRFTLGRALYTGDNYTVRSTPFTYP